MNPMDYSNQVFRALQQLNQNIIALANRISQLEGYIQQLAQRQGISFQQEAKVLAMLQDELDALKAQVAQETTVVSGAVTLINGFAAQLAAAVAAAQAQGATPVQLQQLTDLTTQIKSSSDALAAAVQANTPAAPSS